MSGSDPVPYSKRGLENLAAALNINTAYLWINPESTTFQIRDTKAMGTAQTSHDDMELAEDDE